MLKKIMSLFTTKRVTAQSEPSLPLAYLDKDKTAAPAPAPVVPEVKEVINGVYVSPLRLAGENWPFPETARPFPETAPAKKPRKPRSKPRAKKDVPAISKTKNK